MRQSHKPLSFSTTMRNPERISSFIESLIPYENEVLTNELVKRIIKDWIIKKLIRTDTANKVYPKFKEIYYSDLETFSDEEADFIYHYVESNTKGHKDAGFDKGWPTRFNTYMLLPMEFGYIYYKMGEKIEISETGKLLLKSYNEPENTVSVTSEDIFLNALVKYQTNNPFRRNLIMNAPFVLFLKTVKILSEKYSWEKTGIYRDEIPFVICWENSDAESLAKYINDFRTEYGKNPSEEVVYERCLQLIKSNNKKRFKKTKIVKEGVDDFIRKLRITGVISLRGNGKLVDINRFEYDRVNYIIEKYSQYKSYDKTKDYYHYMSQIDDILVETHTVISKEELVDVRAKTLEIWASEMRREDISKEFKALTNVNGSQHPVLKYINGPTRFEFLMSIALKYKYPNLDIQPNYPVDDEGMPTSTAKGGVADIEVYGEDENVLVEVTLMRNKSQATNEIPGITRHLSDLIKEKERNAYAMFVAPSIHTDTQYMIDFSKYQKNITIYPFTIDDFILIWKDSSEFSDLTV